MNWLHLLGSFICDVTPFIATIIFGLIGMFIIKNVKSKDTLNKLEIIANIAKQAVVQAEKDGVLNNLSGSQKFQMAVKYVQDALNSLGITNADINIIKQKVEAAYANEKNIIESAYNNTSDTKTTVSSSN